VPTEWIFEYYLKLTEKLTGQKLMVLSPFNVNDKNPSLSLFVNVNNKTYRFKDFSTDKGGDALDFVQKLFTLFNRGDAAHKIIKDYNVWLSNNKEDYSSRVFIIQNKYEVTSFVTRKWSSSDGKFWTKFHINSKILEKYHVVPLESYCMSREKDGALQEITITGRHYIYGYFKADGTLYKIYQPMVPENKFIKVRDYIQGYDQLTYTKKYLVLNSSLKDIMFFDKLGYEEAETIAPDSENILIPLHVIDSLKLKYKGIAALFDNDSAGVKAMEQYEKVYGIKGVLLPLSKDLSDSGKDYGILKVKQVLTPILKQALQ
jgi:hypothetical protein